MTIAEKYAQQYQPNGEVSLADLIQAALDEQALAFKGELQAYDGMVRELTKTVEDMQAAQSVAVVGEPTDAAYKWLIAHGVEPMASLHKLGKRLAGLLDEDQFAECETLLLTAITAINTFVPVPAAELATLREKAAMADSLLAIRLPYDADLSCKAMCENAIDAAIAQEGKK